MVSYHPRVYSHEVVDFLGIFGHAMPCHVMSYNGAINKVRETTCIKISHDIYIYIYIYMSNKKHNM